MNNLFICFSNRKTINKLISVKKSCILKLLKKKDKEQFALNLNLNSNSKQIESKFE